MNTVKKLLVSIPAMTLVLAGFAQQNDTGFVARNIRNHIISIKMAQMAQERSDAPHIKSLARDVISTDRETLGRLLVLASPGELSSPSSHELDSLINNFRTDSILSPMDTEGASLSGNTASDSTGSGVTGSGDVNGNDTGTMARSHSNKKNASYSSEGDYLYRNQPAIEALKGIDKKKGRQFNQSWLRYMLSSADMRLRDFENESNITKDEKLKMAVIQAIPYLRSQKDLIAKTAGRKAAPGQSANPRSSRAK